MLRAVLHNRIGKAFFQMSGASTLVQVAALCLTPILSRLYSPAEYASFGILCSLSSFFSIIAAFRYEYAFFIKKRYVEYFFIICLVLIVATSIPAAIIFSLSFDFSFPILLAAFLSTAFFSVMTQFAVAKSQYGKLSMARVWQGSAQYILALLMGFIFLPQGLIYSYLIGQFFAGIYLFVQGKYSFFSLKRERFIKIIRQNARYAANSTFTSALQWSTPLAPMLIGNLIFPAETLGIYFIISQGISAATSIPRRSLINICTSELNSPKRFREQFVPFIKKVLQSRFLFWAIGLGIALGVIFLFYGEAIVSFLLGDRWRSGGDYIGILILFGILDIFLYPFIHLLNLWGKYKSVIMIEISRVCSIFLAIPLVTYYLSWGFPTYITLHLGCMFLFNMITLLFIWKAAKKEPHADRQDNEMYSPADPAKSKQ